MGVTDDRNDQRLTFGSDEAPREMAEVYLVLSDSERAKGFVRPLRKSYWHRDGCQQVTLIGTAIAETYARQPSFYGATYCVGCSMHRPIGEFRWVEDGAVVGS